MSTYTPSSAFAPAGSPYTPATAFDSLSGNALNVQEIGGATWADTPAATVGLTLGSQDALAPAWSDTPAIVAGAVLTPADASGSGMAEPVAAVQGSLLIPAGLAALALAENVVIAIDVPFAVRDAAGRASAGLITLTLQRSIPMTDISERLEDARRIMRIAGALDGGGHQEVAVDFDGLLKVNVAALTFDPATVFNVMPAPFSPVGGTVALAFSGTSARTALPVPGSGSETLKIHNPTDHMVFVRLGDASVTALIPDFPVLPRTDITLRHSIDPAVPQTHLAAIAEIGAGTIYCTLGAGR